MAIFCYFFNRFGARYVDIQPSTNLLFDARETERIAEERARRSQAASNRHNCILFYSAAYGTGPPTDDTHTATTGTTVSRRLFYFYFFFVCVHVTLFAQTAIDNKTTTVSLTSTQQTAKRKEHKFPFEARLPSQMIDKTNCGWSK